MSESIRTAHTLGERAARLKARLAHLSPTSRLLVSFAFLIAVGAALLALPASVAEGHTPLAFVDALFISTSSVCVTGLSTINVGARLSGFGQAVLLLLIQLGGLGFLTLSTGLLVSLGLRSSLLSRVAVTDSLASRGEGQIRGLLRSLFLSTLAIELAGAAVLAWRFAVREGLPAGTACWFGLFHAVSSFCNAGFSTFSRAAGHAGDNLAAYAQDPLVNLTVMALIVAGGLGFLVLDDLYRVLRSRGAKRLDLHSKIVLSVSAALVLGGALLLYLFERDRLFQGQAWYAGIWPSLFQSVSARTAGYNTVDVGALSSPALLTLIVLMFVGGSPASCAGGVKTTTAFVIFQVAVARFLTRRHARAFGREIGLETVARAATLILISFLIVTLFAGVLLVLETNLAPRSSGGLFLDVLFETMSAFGTVGLSTGITPELAAGAKLALVALMYIGRVGPLTLFLALAQPPLKDKVRYPEEPVLVG